MPNIQQWQRSIGRRVVVLAFGAACLCGGLVITNVRAADRPPSTEELMRGRELFTREWLPHDSRARGGDGLGPVFNESSCAACHSLGGIGGAGPANKNVEIVSAFSTQQRMQRSDPLGLPGFVIGSLFGRPPGTRQPAAKPDPKKETEELVRIHPGFRGARSVVLHRFSTNPTYENWRLRRNGAAIFAPSVWVDEKGVERVGVDFDAPELERPEAAKEISGAVRANQLRQQMRLSALQNRSAVAQSQHGNFTLIVSQRNTTSLFGAGLIDSIPDQVLETAAETKHSNFPGISGRLSRLANGKIGRFGWKAQTAGLREFAMTACAVELGLNVPEHEQAGLVFKPDYRPPGLDMDANDCNALVAFLKQLPSPAQRFPAGEPQVRIIESGKSLFASVGCAACHTPKLGDVDGIYSDLLVHDMGQELGDTGHYGVFIPSPGEEGNQEPVPAIAEAFSVTDATASDPAKKIIGATRLEWRTPPLWGFRDSGPYLHDGRAETLDQAIAFHGGEGEESTRRYFALSDEQRFQVTSFLKSLVAPE